VQAGVGDQPDTLFWISGNALHKSILEPLTSGPGGSAEPGGSGGPGASGGSGSPTPSTAAP